VVWWIRNLKGSRFNSLILGSIWSVNKWLFLEWKNTQQFAVYSIKEDLFNVFWLKDILYFKSNYFWLSDLYFYIDCSGYDSDSYSSNSKLSWNMS
jgi:hypothetical protein